MNYLSEILSFAQPFIPATPYLEPEKKEKPEEPEDEEDR